MLNEFCLDLTRLCYGANLALALLYQLVCGSIVVVLEASECVHLPCQFVVLDTSAEVGLIESVGIKRGLGMLRTKGNGING